MKSKPWRKLGKRCTHTWRGGVACQKERHPTGQPHTAQIGGRWKRWVRCWSCDRTILVTVGERADGGARMRRHKFPAGNVAAGSWCPGSGT